MNVAHNTAFPIFVQISTSCFMYVSCFTLIFNSWVTDRSYWCLHDLFVTFLSTLQVYCSVYYCEVQTPTVCDSAVWRNLGLKFPTLKHLRLWGVSHAQPLKVPFGIEAEQRLWPVQNRIAFVEAFQDCRQSKCSSQSNWVTWSHRPIRVEHESARTL